ncbi:cupin domain-containing protein [Paenibacillus alginolyticus]|uniref:cupin domain-containing protein n=1 Tax=Paenibacillus alginolyticus TaxID=59839 RepID=UPI0028ADADCF|nr:AraC family ligand binding domain-containing protein [Paenibacillus frigoriresistens]
MSFQTVSPYVRIAMDSIIQSPWMLKERMIWDYELLYLMEGRADITIEDKIYEGRPGDLFLLKPGQRHSIQIVGD